VTLSVFSFVLAASGVGAIGMWAGSRRADARLRRERWTKFATYIAVIDSVLLGATLGRAPFTALMLVVLCLGATELHALPHVRPVARVAMWAAYVLCAAGVLAFASLAAPPQIMLVYLLVALFDGFSQIVGQLFGARRLAPRLSPGKSVEGAAGGAFAAVAGALLMCGPLGMATVRALSLALVVAAASLAGDLGASAVKRTAGVKDFGRLLPGHGGVLDRFDSFLLAAPVSLVVLLAP